METVTRAQVVEAAQKAIGAVSRLDPGVAEELMNVAHTVTRLSVDWCEHEQVQEGSCGCLVGTYRMRLGERPHPNVHTPEWWVGNYFPIYLLGYGWRDGPSVFRVEDPVPAEVELAGIA